MNELVILGHTGHVVLIFTTFNFSSVDRFYVRLRVLLFWKLSFLGTHSHFSQVNLLCGVFFLSFYLA